MMEDCRNVAFFPLLGVSLRGDCFIIALLESIEIPIGEDLDAKKKTDELMKSRVTLFDPILEDLQVIFTQK